MIKERVIVKKGTDLYPLRVDEIAYFYLRNKLTFVIDLHNNKYIIEKPLTELEEKLDKKKFLRVSRQYLINISCIKKFKRVGGKVEILLGPEPGETIRISHLNANEFLCWVDD